MESNGFQLRVMYSDPKAATPSKAQVDFCLTPMFSLVGHKLFKHSCVLYFKILLLVSGRQMVTSR